MIVLPRRLQCQLGSETVHFYPIYSSRQPVLYCIYLSCYFLQIFCQYVTGSQPSSQPSMAGSPQLRVFYSPCEHHSGNSRSISEQCISCKDGALAFTDFHSMYYSICMQYIVLILDGNSEPRGAHARSDLGYLIRLRHLIRSRIVTNQIFFFLKKTCFPSHMRNPF